MEIAAVCWAIGTLMMRRAHLTLPVETLTVWMHDPGQRLPVADCRWPANPGRSWQFTAAMWASLAYGAFINYGFAQTHLVRPGAPPAAGHQRHERHGHPAGGHAERHR